MREPLSRKSSPLTGPAPPRYPAHVARQRESSTPELPPMPKLSPGPASAPRVPRSSPGRRFSDSEKLAFGRRACWYRHGSASSSKGNSTCSSADVSTAASTTASAAESCSVSLRTSNAPSPRGQRDFDQGQLKRVLDRLLPVNGATWSSVSDLSDSEALPIDVDDRPQKQQQGGKDDSELKDLNTSVGMQGDVLRQTANITSSEPTFASLPPLPVTPPQVSKQPVVACTPLPAYGGISTPGFSTPGGWTDSTCRVLVGSVDRMESFSTPACGSTQLPHQMPSCGSSQDRRGRRVVLQQLRRHLLEHFRSVHDALSRLETVAPRERGLSVRELRLSMERLGVDEKLSEEVFAVLASTESSKVSLADVRHALVEDSPEALLWELRCHLLSMGIQPRCTEQAIRKAVDLVQLHPEKSTAAEYRIQRTTQSVKRMRQRRRRRSCGARYVASAVGAISNADTTDVGWSSEHESSGNTQLDRDDWHRFGSCLDLTAFETDALFTVLGGDDVGKVDLRGMLVVLRATVAPDVSLERFVTRVLAKYGSLRCAFEAVCAERQDRLMRWPEFRNLAASLDVNDRNATNLWDVLSAMKPEDSWPGSPVAHTPTPTSVGASLPHRIHAKSDAGDDSRRGISEDLFEQQLLVWAPGTALDALRDQICEKFGSLAQGRRVLQRSALMLQRAFLQGGECSQFDGPDRPGLATLTPMSLNAVLQASGLNFAETDRVIAAAAVAQDGGVTLDSLMDVLRATQMRQSHLSNHSSAKSILRDDTFPLWQRLHAVQADLAAGVRKHDRRDLGEPIDLAMAAAKAAAESPAPRRYPSCSPPRASPPRRRKAFSPGLSSPQPLQAQKSPPTREGHALPHSHGKRLSVGSEGKRRTPRNPFKPLYKAVASAVRSVSRRSSRGPASHGKDMVHTMEATFVRQRSRSVEWSDE
mmetsp:Transcript_105214/g.166091  ORF Transcript_105214/g.166091 Transcript_105214/m.166091 type:complete len:928 (+) Transcript_105214:43-2826(+)